MAYPSKWEMKVIENQTRDIRSHPPPPHPPPPYLFNTPTNLCIALLNFELFCLILHFYAFVHVQYCNVRTIQYNAMYKFVRVLDNNSPIQEGLF